jgi:hypothetical protein
MIEGLFLFLSFSLVCSIIFLPLLDGGGLVDKSSDKPGGQREKKNLNVISFVGVPL